MRVGRKSLKLGLLLSAVALLVSGIASSVQAKPDREPICFCTDGAAVCCVVDGVSVIGKKFQPSGEQPEEPTEN